MPPLLVYTLGEQRYEITLVKLVIGVIIIGFAFFELLPGLNRVAFDRKYLVVGGVLSGFFGGLSGNQGAFRSMFLLKAALDKEAFIGTGTVSAVIVDVARLFVYGMSFYTVQVRAVQEIGGLVLAATLAAFLGAFLGARLLKKVTLRTVQILIGVMLILIGLGMAGGVY